MKKRIGAAGRSRSTTWSSQELIGVVVSILMLLNLPEEKLERLHALAKEAGERKAKATSREDFINAGIYAAYLHILTTYTSTEKKGKKGERKKESLLQSRIERSFFHDSLQVLQL